MPFDAFPEEEKVNLMKEWKVLPKYNLDLSPPKTLTSPFAYRLLRDQISQVSFDPWTKEMENIPAHLRIRRIGAKFCFEAARYINEKGWCQGVMEDYIGQVCALGAIQKSYEVHNKAHYYLGMPPVLIEQAIEAATGELEAVCGMNVPQFNDQFGTRDSIVQALYISHVRLTVNNA